MQVKQKLSRTHNRKFHTRSRNPVAPEKLDAIRKVAKISINTVTANVNALLSTDGNKIADKYVRNLQHRLYECLYRNRDVDTDFVNEFYAYLRKHFSMMILSDDAVVCFNSTYASQGLVASIKNFKSVLYYQNNVFMSEAKCWTETDLTKGPHEFCSQHTMLVKQGDDYVYLPYPDPSRILGAGCFVDDIVKTDGTLMIERFVSLAIDAYPLTKHPNQEYADVFHLYLQYIRKLHDELTGHMLDMYSVMLTNDNTSRYWEPEFMRLCTHRIQSYRLLGLVFFAIHRLH